MATMLHCLVAITYVIWAVLARSHTIHAETAGRQIYHSNPDQCGTTMYEALGKRIVGGSRSKPGQWPWQVYITYSNNVTFACSGSIISNMWIVTAAHCIQHPDDAGGYMIKVGEYSTSQHDGSEQYFSVNTIIVNPAFDKVTAQNDIALIQVNGRIGFNNHVRMICLPLPTSSHSSCVVSGWGETRDFGDTGYLKHAPVSIISLAACRADYAITGYDIFDNNICAASTQGTNDACEGDSGGPLVCEEQGVWHLKGIVSWGKECGKSQYPGIYTRVRSFSQWIQNTLQKR